MRSNRQAPRQSAGLPPKSPRNPGRPGFLGEPSGILSPRDRSAAPEPRERRNSPRGEHEQQPQVAPPIADGASRKRSGEQPSRIGAASPPPTPQAWRSESSVP
ncbi:hypothetical protein [Paludisphaera borealis]|uniref:hypothetical protein n=1 Tax=Paludisphaera borealis TaxID=1387353 RepID=UPI0011AB797C|nr:hypothetical protein [Paludisphaera borealis]